ncbi:hypothetical protein CBS147345_1857 [Aspergillus niger]|nr:hypothetical protein CBS147345_1857 [Aspergillus niger]
MSEHQRRLSTLPRIQRQVNVYLPTASRFADRWAQIAPPQQKNSNSSSSRRAVIHVSQLHAICRRTGVQDYFNSGQTTLQMCVNLSS